MSSTDGTAGNAGAAWWIVALDTPTAWGCAAVAVGCAVGMAWLFVLVWKSGRAGRVGRSQTRGSVVGEGGLGGEAGTATIEFALVFPVLLVMVLTLIQTTLMFTGNLFIHYAAFSAARRAIVEIPRDLPGEGPNRIALSNSRKREGIRRAAVLAMMPVSGPGTASRSSVGGVIDQLYRQAGQDPPRWADTLVDRRLGYADQYTDVQVAKIDPRATDVKDIYQTKLPASTTPDGVGVYDAGEFGPRDAVGVVVTHEFFLSVPFVARFFSDGGDGDDDRRYAELVGRFMLTNEGVMDVLPPKPEIPRRVVQP